MPLWLAGEPLVLASKSAIRHALLRDAGVPVEVQPADIDERTIEQRSPARDAGELAALLAREKAQTIAARFPGRLVLGADQTLALGERRFSKPGDRAGARVQLEALRGRTHELHTAVALIRESTIVFEHREVARLTMRAFSDSFLESYLDADEKLRELYADRDEWARKAILNIAGSGKFSSDRTIAQYAAEIWNAKPCPVT